MFLQRYVLSSPLFYIIKQIGVFLFFTLTIICVISGKLDNVLSVGNPCPIQKNNSVISQRYLATDGTNSPTNDGSSGSNTGRSSKSDNSGGGKKGNWWCPKCGDPCTHVDTFVCEYNFIYLLVFI